MYQHRQCGTVNDDRRNDLNDFRSETCIIGFDGNLYGQNLEVRLLDRIRDEKRFNSDEALSNQIQLDAAESRQIFRRRNRENV